ncbi:MAG: hypothetical protein IKN80_05435 [Clostridiales bacterium]|nr:hypothetical protein [Clostridiales bacterium]
MVHLSKSKYTGLWQCAKMAWLRQYKPEEAVIDESVLSRMKDGRKVGKLARGLFGDHVDVTAYNGERLDLSKMIANTAAEISAFRIPIFHTLPHTCCLSDTPG